MSTDTSSGIQASVGEAALPLNRKKQSALLGFAFQPQTRIFSYLSEICQTSWWSDPLHGVIWQYIKEFWDEYKKPPLFHEVRENSKLLQREVAEQKRLQSLLDTALVDATQFHHEPLRDEIQIWLQAKILQNAYTKGAHLWNSQKYAESTEIMRTTIKELNNTRFLDSYERKLTDIAEIAKDLGPQAVLPFGVAGIDNHLFPNNPKGSLRKGDQSVVMAPVNMGKSTTLITVAVHNIRAGNDVLFVSHEGHRSDLRLKMIRCYLTLIDDAEIRKIYGKDTKQEGVDRVRNEMRRIAALPLIDIVDYMLSVPPLGSPLALNWKIFNKVLEYAQSHITFMPIHRPGMEVEDITQIIERAQDTWRDNHRDADGTPKGYDLFVCDYPGVLSTKQNNKGNLQWRHVQQIVYDQFVQLALQHEWHSLVAIQTNRAGSQINSGTSKGGERRFLTNEDVAECWGVIMSAANVFTVNRSPEAQTSGRVTFLISKSRSSTTGYAVTCYGNFGQGVSHSDELGYVGYYGLSENKNIMDTFMKPGVRRSLDVSDTAGLGITMMESQ